MRDEASVLRDYLNGEFSRIAKAVVRDLQGIKTTFSGEDSVLENAWDDICVQRQGEESFLQDAYDDTVRQCISWRLNKLPRDLRSFMWFEADTTGAEDVSEYDADELTDHIAGAFVYQLAESHSNRRIERYLWKE